VFIHDRPRGGGPYRESPMECNLHSLINDDCSERQAGEALLAAFDQSPVSPLKLMQLLSIVKS
jgi:hypothetical protein